LLFVYIFIKIGMVRDFWAGPQPGWARGAMIRGGTFGEKKE